MKYLFIELIELKNLTSLVIQDIFRNLLGFRTEFLTPCVISSTYPHCTILLNLPAVKLPTAATVNHTGKGVGNSCRLIRCKIFFFLPQKFLCEHKCVLVNNGFMGFLDVILW